MTFLHTLCGVSSDVQFYETRLSVPIRTMEGVCAQLVSCDRPGHSSKLAICGDCNVSHPTLKKFFFKYFF